MRQFTKTSPFSSKINGLIASSLIIYFRSPALLLEPRLWAEEGTRYLPFAYYYPWYKALVNVQLGYIALLPNIAFTLATNLVSLENTPLVSTGLAFFVQIIPISIILWSTSDFWQGKIKKAIGILIVLFAPLSGEIWLNTINSQFYFALITFLILVENTNLSRGKQWWYRILLVFSGLTGIVSCFLTPLFIFIAWVEKGSERIIQASILLICTIIQLSILWISVKNNTFPNRFPGDLSVLPVVISALWTQSITLVFFGLGSANTFSKLIIVSHQVNSYEFELLSLLLLLSAILLFWYLSRKLSSQKQLIILGSYLLITILSIIGSRGSNKFELVLPGHGGRYFYVPNVILLFLLSSNIHFNKDIFATFRSSLCALLLLLSLAFGVVQYKNPYPPLQNDNWPKWREEIRQWRQDPEKFFIKIWPAGWQTWLDPIEPIPYDFTETLTLIGFHKECTDSQLLVDVLWRGSAIVVNLPQNRYTAYVHLTNKDGERLAGSDKLLEQDPNIQTDFIASFHQIALPSNLPMDFYDLVIGLYYFDDGKLINVDSITILNSVMNSRNCSHLGD